MAGLSKQTICLLEMLAGLLLHLVLQLVGEQQDQTGHAAWTVDLAAVKVEPRQLQLETVRLEARMVGMGAIIQLHLMEELAKAPLLVSLVNLPANSMLVGEVVVFPSTEVPLPLAGQEGTVGVVMVQ